MLMALALLAAIEAAPPPTVSLILSGDNDRPPVSAAPRSLSDVARELRKGRKAVGGFSAFESTVPQRLDVFVPIYEPEPETTEPEPEVVAEAPVYVPSYLPGWSGGQPTFGRHHRHSAGHPAAPRPMARPAVRPSVRPFASPMLRMRRTTARVFRER